MKIDSPISAFNNILVKITSDIQKIYLPKEKDNQASFINKLIFRNDSIIILNKIEIKFIKNEFNFKFHGNFDINSLTNIQISFENKEKLEEILLFYLFTIRKITNNLDFALQETFVKNIENEILRGVESQYIIPYDKKIGKLYDKTLINIMNRYSYVLKASLKPDEKISYKLCRVESNNLSQSKSLENIRYENIEVIKEGLISNKNLAEFIHYLFYYGEIIY